MKTINPTAVQAVPAAPAAPRPTWRVVLALALPVLAQQFLILTVNLSDRFLTGRFASPAERALAVGHRLTAIGLLGAATPGTALPARVVGAEIPWEMGRQETVRQVSYQAAQTTAGYLAWFISSYTVLVSVGSTALVARFTGAGDRAAAVHATNQAILLAAGLGLAGTVAGLAGLAVLIAALQLHGPAGEFAVAYLR